MNDVMAYIFIESQRLTNSGSNLNKRARALNEF